LRERIGGAAQTTLRGQVGNLRAIGALERHVRSGMPYTVENELTDVGRGILAVAEVVEAWLARAPQGPIAFGSEPAKGAIRSLVGGWSSTVLRVLAARPLSLTELSGAIPELSYPSLERRLSAMRASRQVEVLDEPGKARPYAVTDWTRQAVGPLVAAGRCECKHIPERAEPITGIDIEAAFLLAVPLVTLPVGGSGSCQLVVNTGEGGEEPMPQAAGVHVGLEHGEVTSCVSGLEQDPGTWALGPVEAWAEAIADGCFDSLQVGGNDQDLARGLIEGLHRSLSAPG
jgi:DNA-binding HxlR family transcriptional regulator